MTEYLRLAIEAAPQKNAWLMKADGSRAPRLVRACSAWWGSVRRWRQSSRIGVRSIAVAKHADQHVRRHRGGGEAQSKDVTLSVASSQIGRASCRERV